MQLSTEPENLQAQELGGAVPLHALTYLEEDGEVTVGCPDINAYAVLPADGAALLRHLEGGVAPDQAASWYQRTYGESVDMAEFIAALQELGFVRDPGDGAAPGPRPVRWARLGRAIFSPVGALAFVAILGTWLAVMFRFRQLVPANHDLFFTKYMSVLILVLFVCQLPLILIHESFHALAGRRLGLRSKLSVGRRLYYIVFQTEMDGLVGVPRRKRYLPILAGMIFDVAAVAILSLVAAVTMEAGGRLSLVGRVALAVAYVTLLRLAWQFLFYLETDVYYMVSTALSCVNLQAAARAVLRNRVKRLARRNGKPADLAGWHSRDLSVARWYSWLILAGWTFSLTLLLVVGLPITVHMFAIAGGRFVHWKAQSAASLLDSSIFIFVNLIQVAGLAWLAYRDRRRRITARHILS
jgi:hypothetical protein